MNKYTSPVTAEDVTEEMVQAAVDIVDGWYQGSRIDWGDVLDRLDGTLLDDGTRLDLGNDLTTPAIAKIKKDVRARLRES